MNFVKRMGYDLKHNYILLLMLLPGIALFVLFRYLPMYGLLISFKNYQLFKGFYASPWVGLKHFRAFFSDPYAYRIIRNTFLLGFYNILFSFPAPIVLALILNEVRRPGFKRFTQTVSYIPYFISTVIIVGLLKTFLSTDNGVINNAIKALGGQPIVFFNEAGWFRTLYIASDIWQSVGYGSILYLAAITGIDQELYEAARIDGASRFQNILHITVPSLLPTITILLIMRMGSIISVGFEKVYLMYSPATYETADVISTYVYRTGMTGDANIGKATAIGFFNSIVSLVFVTGTNFISKRVLHESLW